MKTPIQNHKWHKLWKYQIIPDRLWDSACRTYNFGGVIICKTRFQTPQNMHRQWQVHRKWFFFSIISFLMMPCEHTTIFLFWIFSILSLYKQKLKKLVSMISKYHNHKPTPGIVTKSYRTFSVTRHPKDNNSKATNSPFLVNMIAKPERTQSNAHQNKDQLRTPQTM